MKPKTKFKKMYYKMPKKARTRLVIYHRDRPYSLAVCELEVDAGTKLGDEFLGELGYLDNI